MCLLLIFRTRIIVWLALNCSVGEDVLEYHLLGPSSSAGITGRHCWAKRMYWHLMNLLSILSSHQDIGVPEIHKPPQTFCWRAGLRDATLSAQGPFSLNFSSLVALSQSVMAEGSLRLVYCCLFCLPNLPMSLDWPASKFSKLTVDEISGPHTNFPEWPECYCSKWALQWPIPQCYPILLSASGTCQCGSGFGSYRSKFLGLLQCGRCADGWDERTILGKEKWLNR